MADLKTAHTVENMDQYQPRVRLQAFEIFQPSYADMFCASRDLSRGFFTFSIFHCAAFEKIRMHPCDISKELSMENEFLFAYLILCGG